jgi:outer membrane lipoprotein-sorting protein
MFLSLLNAPALWQTTRLWRALLGCSLAAAFASASHAQQPATGTAKRAGSAANRAAGEETAGGKVRPAAAPRISAKAPAKDETSARFQKCLNEALAAAKNVKDYSATFSKKELIGKKLIQQTMEMKFREKPFSVYFRYTSDDEKGREVIYVDGKFNNELLIHETGLKGLAGTLRFKPSHPMVMGENRHQITDVGIANIARMAAEQYERDLTDPDLETKVYPKARLDDLPCTALVVKHARPGKDWAFSDIRVYYDHETKLPIHVERYGWPRRGEEKAPLVEEYTYRNLRLNVGLRDIDFDPRNPSYSY